MRTRSRDAPEKQAQPPSQERKKCHNHPTIQVESLRHRFDGPKLRKTQESEKENKLDGVNNRPVRVSIMRAMDHVDDREEKCADAQNPCEFRHALDFNAGERVTADAEVSVVPNLAGKAMSGPLCVYQVFPHRS